MHVSSIKGRFCMMVPVFSLMVFALAWHAVPPAFPAAATVDAPQDRYFVEHWTGFDEMIQVQELRGFRKKIEVPFGSLPPFKGHLAIPPEKGPIEQVLVLSSAQNRAVLLVTPRNTLSGAGFLGEDLRQALQRCATDHSWIVALPENAWTAVDLNPHCTMAYDESGILVDLYWTQSSSRPLIDISTNGFKCVSHRLYGWDRRTSSYGLRAEKCTGSRPAESYSSGTAMRQVYPPGGEPQGKSGSLRPWSPD